MSHSWPLVRLGDVLTLQRRWLVPEVDRQYMEIGVRSFGRGIFHKAPVTGAELGNKRVLRIEAGDLVLMNVFAWEGAVAVAGAAEAGMIGSHRYATYTADPARCIPDFLNLYFKTQSGLELLRRVSPGSAGRNRTLNLAQFVRQSVPLPPIEEQRRIVTRVEAIAAKVEEAQRLQATCAAERQAIVTAGVAKLMGKPVMAGTLDELLTEPPTNGWSPHRDGSNNGVPVLSLGAVTGFRFRPSEYKRTSQPIANDSKYWLNPGDLLITRSNTPQLVGHSAIYEGVPEKCVFPDLMMRIPVDTSRAHTRFVYWWLRSAIARDFVRSRAKGTSPSMVKISQKDVMAIPVPALPSLSEQRRVADRLAALERSVDDLGAIQEERASRLDGLVAAALARAFEGNL